MKNLATRTSSQVHNFLITHIGLIRNSYGNYVVQKALKIGLGKDKQGLINAIQRCIPSIPDRKIRQKWESIIADAAQNI